MDLRKSPAILRPTSATVNVVCHGNSLTIGIGASSAAACWPAVMAGLFPLQGTGITPINAGVSGQTISVSGGNGDMTNTGPTAVDAQLVAGRTNILFALEFTNELGLNGVSAAAAYAAWKACLLARKAAAAAAGKTLKIFTMTCPPAYTTYPVDNTTYNNAIRTVNAQMRLDYRSYSDKLVDLAAWIPQMAAIFAAGTYTQAEFIAAGIWSRSDAVANDYTHFGDSGYALIAGQGANALRSLPAR